MKLRPLQFLAAIAAIVALAGCSPLPRAPLSTRSQTTLTVENHAFLDMTIYVLRGSERVRLGLATGSGTSTFTIPAYLTQMSPSLHFIADPIGGSRAEISEEITVSPGDDVVLQIPPA